MSIERKTIFSECREYRYTLWRDWSGEFKTGVFFTECPHVDYYIGKRDGFVQFIGLNPSTADEKIDDPTIRRCVGFSKAWGFGALCMTNAFAFRETQPKLMMLQKFPETSPNEVMTNMDYLSHIGFAAGLVVAAWGKDGNHLKQQDRIRTYFKGAKIKLHHLGLNGDGTPKHPLYLKKTTQPVLWTP